MPESQVSQWIAPPVIVSADGRTLILAKYSTKVPSANWNETER